MSNDKIVAAPAGKDDMLFTTMKDLISEAYSSSVQGINVGFALAAALAWTEAVKVVIQKYVKSTQAAKFHVMYALIVTLLSGVVFMVTKRFLKPSMKKTTVTPVVGMMM